MRTRFLPELFWPAVLLVLARAGTTQSIDSVPVRAEDFAGADLGTRINSADAACTRSRKPCIISVNTHGTISTPIVLARGHSLQFTVPVAMTAAITPAGSQTISCGKGVVLTMSAPAAMIKPVEGATDIEVSGCTATGVGQNFVELPGRNARITVRGNITSGFGNALFACPAVPKSAGGWDLTMLCHDVDFTGNTVLSSTGTGVQYLGVSGGHITGNTIGHAPEGVYLNGGEADPTHELYARHSDGLAGITVSENTVHDINNGCIWATVSSGHVFSGNHLSHCGDVAVDFEGVSDSKSSGNVIADAGHRGGALATFFGSSRIDFKNDTVIVTRNETSAGGPAIWVHNSTNDPAFTGPITFSGINVRSEVPNATTTAIFESQHGLRISGSHFANVQFSMPFRFNGLQIEDNDFRFSVPVSGGAALAIGVSLYGGTDSVSNNRFSSSVPQPPNSTALSMTYSDYNASEKFLLNGNDFTGAAAFPVDISVTHTGVNPGLGSQWVLQGNLLNRPPVTHSNGVGTFSLQLDKGQAGH